MVPITCTFCVMTGWASTAWGMVKPVSVVVPVPPLATGRVPVTLVVRFANVVDVVPVPPLAIGSVPVTCEARFTPVNAPPRVRLPELVTVPVKVMPLTVPVPPTEVTVPVPGVTVEAIVMPPAELVTVMPEPAVSTARVNPVPLPMSNWPFVGVAVRPVPPLAIGSVPVTPVVRGKPVAFVKVPDVGVPKIGVTSVGLMDSTTLPVPVEVVTPVPPFATGVTLAAISLTTPAEFLKYNFSSIVLIASSPAARLPAIGKAEAVELL